MKLVFEDFFDLISCCAMGINYAKPIKTAGLYLDESTADHKYIFLFSA